MRESQNGLDLCKFPLQKVLRIMLGNSILVYRVMGTLILYTLLVKWFFAQM